MGGPRAGFSAKLLRLVPNPSEQQSTARMKGSAFDSLFNRGLEPSESFQRALEDIGVDLKNLEDDYPVSVWNRALDLARDAFFPGRSAAEGDLELGRRFVAGYERTLLGSIIMAPSSLLSPGQLLDRYPRYAGSGGGEVSADAEALGERSHRVYYRAVGARPHLVAGILLECLERAGTQATVQVEPRPVGDFQLTFSW